jgi:hypothetical protein
MPFSDSTSAMPAFLSLYSTSISASLPSYSQINRNHVKPLPHVDHPLPPSHSPHPLRHTRARTTLHFLRRVRRVSALVHAARVSAWVCWHRGLGCEFCCGTLLLWCARRVGTRLSADRYYLLEWRGWWLEVSDIQGRGEGADEGRVCTRSDV